MENQAPKIWVAKDDSKILLGVFNWKDNPASINIIKHLKNFNISIDSATDIWTNEVCDMKKIMISGRDAKVFSIEV